MFLRYDALYDCNWLLIFLDGLLTPSPNVVQFFLEYP